MSPEQVVAVFSAHARCHPDVLALAAPHLPAVMQAILEGAAKPGTLGASDRATLFKMLGLPWGRFDPTGGRDNTPAGLAGELQRRLGSAVARIEGQRRRTTVTVSVSEEDEPAADRAPRREAHVLSEHARYSAPTIDGTAEPSPPSPARGR